MSASMAVVIERHHVSHADWDEQQFAILCHCGTEVVGEDNGEEAYTQEEALYAEHLAAALEAAGFGQTQALVERVRAALRLISPEDINPMGVRILEKVLDAHTKHTD